MIGFFLDRSCSPEVVLGCYLLLLARVPDVVVFCHGIFLVFSVSERIALLFQSSAGCSKLFRHLVGRFSCVKC